MSELALLATFIFRDIELLMILLQCGFQSGTVQADQTVHQMLLGAGA